MLKNQKGFGHLYILLIVIMVGVIGLVGWRVFNQRSHAQKKSVGNQTSNYVSSASNSQSQYPGGYDTTGLPDCSGNAVLSQAFADPSTYKDIVPLGNNSSWNGNVAHVLPVNHMYLEYGGPPTDANGSPIETIPLVAPGNIKIMQVIATSHANSNGVDTLNDGTVYFASCKQVIFWLGHVQDFNSAITNAIQSATNKDCSNTFVIDGITYNNCTYNVSLNLKAGTAIGKGGVDFGAVDYRIKPQAFLRPSSQEYLYSVCGIDYFAEPYRTQMYQKLKNTKIDANGLPDCGTDMWDKIGTIQGNWFLPNVPKSGGVDAYALAATPLNTDPSQGDIDWAGAIAPADRLIYKITANGIINRDPSAVTADGKVYCFQDTSQGTAYAYSVMLQLQDSNTLKAQYKKGLCPASPVLTSPTTYIR